jgi:hypothetical protein
MRNKKLKSSTHLLALHTFKEVLLFKNESDIVRRNAIVPANTPKFEKSTTYSMFITTWACYIPKMTFLAFPQKKPFIETSKKHRFSAHSTRLLTPEAKIEKNRTYSLNFRQG